jgi:hypothetical protein
LCDADEREIGRERERQRETEGEGWDGGRMETRVLLGYWGDDLMRG